MRERSPRLAAQKAIPLSTSSHTRLVTALQPDFAGVPRPLSCSLPETMRFVLQPNVLAASGQFVVQVTAGIKRLPVTVVPA